MSDPLAVAVRDAVAEAVDMQFWGVVDLGILTGSLRDAGVRVTGDASLRQTPLVTGDADGTRTRAVYVAPSEYAPLADILLAHVLPDGSERSEAAEFARRLRPHLVVAPPNHPDDGHVHSFGCRLCGVDAPPSDAAALLDVDRLREAAQAVVVDSAWAEETDGLMFVKCELLEALAAALTPTADTHDPDYLCPNCVTPWRCNGPHIPEGEA